MKHETTEGIVLRCLDYQERSRILTLFTPSGLLSVIIKAVSRKKPQTIALSSPFCCAEWHFERGRGEIVKMIDGSILKDFYALRQTYTHIRVMGGLAQAILLSQAPGKPAHLLYEQFKSYLDKVCTAHSPEVLCTSFYLKTLKYEGLLALSKHCVHCQKPNASALHQGESFCPFSAPSSSMRFSKEEWQKLLDLTDARSFSELEQITVPSSLAETIEAYFRAQWKG